MQGGTHLVAGLAVGLGIARWQGISDPVDVSLIVTAASVSALAPDWLQVNVPGLNKTIKGAFGHRGFSHWMLTVYAVWWAVGAFQPAASASVPLALSAAAGWLSHIVLDAFNSPGVPAFWPLPWRLKLAHIKSGGSVDQAVAWLCGAAVMWGVLGLA